MSEQWNQWEGQTADGKFPLRQFLGTTEHSAVFLTQISEPQPKNAAIKFLLAEPLNADTQLALWKRAAHLFHPNLLGMFDCGRCRLGERDLLYVVTEYAEENLGEILPQRPLAAEEARDFLEPALDVLVYLHAKGLAHGHIKPSNLLATQDCLKLSSDTLLTIGAQAELCRSGDAYDAPELTMAPVSAKADVWSLGATLLEALTQKPLALAAQQAGDPAVPESLPDMLREIVRHSLRRHEAQRWSVGEIAARLNPASLAAAAVMNTAPVTAVPPLSVPLSTEPAVPLAKLPAVPEVPNRRNARPTRGRGKSPFGYFVPALLGAAVVIGLIFAIPKMFHFQNQPVSSAASISNEPSATQPSATTTARTETAPAKTRAAETPSKPHERPAAAPSPSPSAAIMREDSTAPARAKTARDVAGRGQVLDQVLPKAAPQALATIQGTVRVLVKVHVDAAGNVSDAELDAPGPSKYFAGLAEKAAREWQFSGAEADGHGVPSEWLIRFEFSQSGVQAFPEQTAP